MTTADKIEIRSVADLSELATYESAWNQIVAESTYLLPFSSYAWVSSFLEHRLLDHETWCCLMAVRGSELVGVLPLVFRPVGGPGASFVFGRTPHDLHTLAVDMSIREGQVEPVAELLVDAAFGFQPRCLYLEFRDLPPDAAALRAFGAQVRKRRILRWNTGSGGILRLQGTFESYHKGLSSNVRSNLRRSANKLQQQGKYECTFSVGAKVTQNSFYSFLDVEASGWKGKKGTAILKSGALVRFYQALVKRLVQAGWIEWQELKINGQVIATNLSIMVAQSSLVWKTAYDESFAKLSPGSLLMDSAIQRGYELGLHEINVVRDDPWNERWGMYRPEYQSVRVVNDGPYATVVAWWAKRLYLLAFRIPGLHFVAHQVMLVIRAFEGESAK